jgi:hypothetical protein
MWWIFEKEFGASILKALQVLVDLALFFQEHCCGRLEMYEFCNRY